MNTTDYKKIWNAVEAPMRKKLEELIPLLGDIAPFTLSDIYQGGDEEFRLMFDISTDDAVVLALDFVLADGEVHGATSGLGIRLDICGYGGLVMGGYAPHNFTDQAFTDDLSELLQRIDGLDVNDLANHVLKESLLDERLLNELERELCVAFKERPAKRKEEFLLQGTKVLATLTNSAGKTVEAQLVRVYEDDVAWRTADDNQEISYDLTVTAFKIQRN